jgi:orotidine-5'-phosphate decarboxylase
METFSTKLKARIANCKNPVCMGIDPVLKLIPLEGTPEQKVRNFYLSLLDEMDHRGVYPAVIKPNSAYFEQISTEALDVMDFLIREYSKRGILVILDAKRGDIGKSSAAYAEAAFGIYKAHAVTVSPYMGSDSLLPFLEHSAGAGVYALLRTSNPGGSDFQNLIMEDGRPLYHHVCDKLIEWDNGSLGAVVGATRPEELEKITSLFTQKNHEIPFLIPGVSIPGVPGQQGGDAASVIQAIRNGGGQQDFHVLNSSSGLNFAWQADGSVAPEVAFGNALEALIEDIQKV